MLINTLAVIGALAVIYFTICLGKTIVELKEDVDSLKEKNKKNYDCEYDD